MNCIRSDLRYPKVKKKMAAYESFVMEIIIIVIEANGVRGVKKAHSRGLWMTPNKAL